MATAEDIPSPLRQGVDIYNSVGSSSRLIAFMKIGASAHDLTYLGFLNAKLNNQPLPKAFVAGGSIYFHGLDEPLKVVDLRRKLFSFNGQRIDLNLPGGIEAGMHKLENTIHPQSSDGASSVLAVAGLTSTVQCLAGGESAKGCSATSFLGALGAIGAVGGLSSSVPPHQAFCGPATYSGSEFVVVGKSQKLVSVAQSGLSFSLAPEKLESSVGQSAAARLLAVCSSPATLSGINTALAYPETPTSTVHISVTRLREPASVRAAPRPGVVESQIAR